MQIWTDRRSTASGGAAACKASAAALAASVGAPSSQDGFTLIEVLVALAIVAIALAAGLQATTALTNNAQRQSNVLLAQICAENELVKARLSKQMPDIGDSSLTCEQGGHSFPVTVSVLPTPNPSFRRVDAQVFDGETPVLRLSTIVGKI
jgi:general secretion pathway protein I